MITQGANILVGSMVTVENQYLASKPRVKYELLADHD